MRIITCILLFCSMQLSAQIPALNQRVIDTTVMYGKTISPTYYSAVCTDFIIGVLGHFIALDSADTVNIRIDQPRSSADDIYLQIEKNSPEPKGVYYALIRKGAGIPIDDWTQVKRGDFVQFWHDHSWGHCGIVDSINVQGKKMWLHSSYPSTDGYGIQQFDIPPYSWFVRLVKTDQPNTTQTTVDQSDKGTQSAPAKNKHSKRKKKNSCK